MPNSGRPMAAMAGAISVTLVKAKAGHYRRGDPAPKPAAHHIRQATQTMYAAAALAWLRWTAAPW